MSIVKISSNLPADTLFTQYTIANENIPSIIHPSIMNHASIEPKYKKELAKEMGISINTLKRRLDKSGLKIPRGYISPDVLQMIYEKIGWSNLGSNGPK